MIASRPRDDGMVADARTRPAKIACFQMPAAIRAIKWDDDSVTGQTMPSRRHC